MCVIMNTKIAIIIIVNNCEFSVGNNVYVYNNRLPILPKKCLLTNKITTHLNSSTLFSVCVSICVFNGSELDHVATLLLGLS